MPETTHSMDGSAAKYVCTRNCVLCGSCSQEQARKLEAENGNLKKKHKTPQTTSSRHMRCSGCGNNVCLRCAKGFHGKLSSLHGINETVFPWSRCCRNFTASGQDLHIIPPQLSHCCMLKTTLFNKTSHASHSAFDSNKAKASPIDNDTCRKCKRPNKCQDTH